MVPFQNLEKCSSVCVCVLEQSACVCTYSVGPAEVALGVPGGGGGAGWWRARSPPQGPPRSPPRSPPQYPAPGSPPLPHLRPPLPPTTRISLLPASGTGEVCTSVPPQPRPNIHLGPVGWLEKLRSSPFYHFIQLCVIHTVYQFIAIS